MTDKAPTPAYDFAATVNAVNFLQYVMIAEGMKPEMVETIRFALKLAAKVTGGLTYEMHQAGSQKVGSDKAVNAYQDLVDALQQWKNAEAAGDADELECARTSRDAALKLAEAV